MCACVRAWVERVCVRVCVSKPAKPINPDLSAPKLDNLVLANGPQEIL